ncbi:MAG: carbamoyltransferase [Ferruginibacter sp.]
MIILGISAYYHDSAAAIIIDGKIVSAAQEERFTRKKNDESFPINAIRFCLDFANVTIDDLDAIAFYDKPLLKFERLLETYFSFAPKGIASFLKAMPVWIKEKLFLKKLIREGLEKIQPYDKRKLKLLFPEHHLSHAAAAFYPSAFDKAAILTIDGVGEWATTTICKGDGNSITILKEMRFPHSVGLLYSAFTYYCGFKVNSGEYKLMGLAPYGNAGSEQVKKFISLIQSNLCTVYEDGSVFLDQDHFNYAAGLTMTDNRKWEKLFGFPPRKPEAALEQHHCDMALAIQLVTEDIMMKLCLEAKRLTGMDNLCMAGGVALNCVANGKLQDEKIFSNIFIQPAAGDAGGACGAALAAYHIYFNKERKTDYTTDALNGAYLGPAITEKEIEHLIPNDSIIVSKIDDEATLVNTVAEKIAGGLIAGWVQGRMEFGPRALGNRSILADPRNREMQKKLNLKIKYRESFRPFAPAVLAEDAAGYFALQSSSAYMQFVHPVKKQFELPANFASLSFMEKLYIPKSELPAVTHIDFSARIQTVHKETNPRFYALLQAFKKITGTPVLVNTSFNVRGEPIVCTAADALNCFLKTEMDILVIGNYIFEKKDGYKVPADVIDSVAGSD